MFIAGTSTFGGRKGLADLEAAFNKRFGTKMKISFAAGPDMNARAARHITEIKVWAQSFFRYISRLAVASSTAAQRKRP